MRLFLSSQDLGHHADVALKMCGPGKRLAFIANAGDGYPESYRSEKVGRKKDLFENAGFIFDELDLRAYFGKQEELAEYLNDIDLVWCNGGNTFILRRAMKASGLDVILQRRLADDSIMYGGSSAGSCVCAPSLQGIDHGDRPDPDSVPADYPSKEIIWEGLDLVPFMIVPHCDQEWFRPSADESISALERTGTSYTLLNDGEVVVVDGKDTKIMQPNHELSRYRPITQKPYYCVPTCLQMVLEKNDLETETQELLGSELGLVVPPEYADEFDSAAISDTPVVTSGFGTRIQDPDYSLEKLIDVRKWPFRFQRELASSIPNTLTLKRLLQQAERQNKDALICYQNDRGYGHVVVFDRITDDSVHVVDPSPLHEKWRTIDLQDLYNRIQSHGDSNSGGVWLLERI